MRPCQLLGAVAEPIHHPGPEVLDHYVGLVQQAVEQFAVTRRLEVERNALLSSVEAHEVRRFVVDERTERTSIVSRAHSLYLDDACSEVSKRHRAIRSRQHTREIDNRYSFKGQALLHPGLVLSHCQFLVE